jgi:uncharacterized protein YoaH (UPF0181 family)
MVAKKVKDIMPILSKVKNNGGKMTILVNGKNSGMWHENKKPELINCRILKLVSKRKQQSYLLVTRIRELKAQKMSLGEGTQVIRVEVDGKTTNF